MHLRVVVQGHEGLLIGQADSGGQRGPIQALWVAALPANVGSPGRRLCAGRPTCHSRMARHERAPHPSSNSVQIADKSLPARIACLADAGRLAGHTWRHGERLHGQGLREPAALPEDLPRQVILGPLLVQHLPAATKDSFLTLSNLDGYDGRSQSMPSEVLHSEVVNRGDS